MKLTTKYKQLTWQSSATRQTVQLVTYYTDHATSSAQGLAKMLVPSTLRHDSANIKTVSVLMNNEYINYFRHAIKSMPCFLVSEGY